LRAPTYHRGFLVGAGFRADVNVQIMLRKNDEAHVAYVAADRPHAAGPSASARQRFYAHNFVDLMSAGLPPRSPGHD
jgi:hypothetical protein